LTAPFIAPSYTLSKGLEGLPFITPSYTLSKGLEGLPFITPSYILPSGEDPARKGRELKFRRGGTSVQ